MSRDDLKQRQYQPPTPSPEKGGTMTVLRAGDPHRLEEVSPPDANGAGLDRSTVSSGELADVAPVKGDARDKNTQADAEPDKPEVFAEVLETRAGVDDGSTGRVTLRAGKRLSSKHYDLARLHRQGVKLRQLTADEVPRVEANPFA